MGRLALVLVLAFLVSFAPAAACAATRSIHGTVTELGERNFVVVDGDGKSHVIWLVPASGYRPGDYRPAIDDTVDVLCYYVSRITKRLYLARVDFVKEGFRPATDAARTAETPQITVSDPPPAAPAEPANP